VRFADLAPAALPAIAASLRDSNDYDGAWVVCDVDQFSVASARQTATEKNVGMALSNPCFEVWLLLHVSHKRSGFNNCDQVEAGRSQSIEAIQAGGISDS
jgi:RloB-like protein